MVWALHRMFSQVFVERTKTSIGMIVARYPVRCLRQSPSVGGGSSGYFFSSSTSLQDDLSPVSKAHRSKLTEEFYAATGLKMVGDDGEVDPFQIILQHIMRGGVTGGVVGTTPEEE